MELDNNSKQKKPRGKNTRLFKLYAANFSATFKKYGLSLSAGEQVIDVPLYVCPLSLRCYSQEFANNGALTIEHVPPQSLGGKGIILTDKHINNTDGSTSDKKLLQFFESENFKSNGGEINALISVGLKGSSRIGAKMSLDEFRGKPRVKFIMPKSNIDVLAYKGMFENWDGGKFHINWSLQSKIDKKGLLKCAYLTAFSKLGYELIFDKKGFKNDTYGKLINYLNGNGTSEEFPLVFIAHHAPLEDWSVGMISSPAHLKCLLVNLTFQLKNRVFNYCVFLPNPDQENLDHLNSLNTLMPLETCTENFKVGYLPRDIGGSLAKTELSS